MLPSFELTEERFNRHEIATLNPERRITIKDVAEEVGVSFSLVASVLRGERRAAAATAERIREAAERLGYRPQVAGSLLARARQERSAREGMKLGWVTRLPSSWKRGNRRREADLVATAAAKLGFGLEWIELSEAASDRAVSRELYHRGIEGLLLGYVAPLGELPDFEWDKFCVVMTKPLVTPSPFHRVQPDHFRAVEMAWRHARAQGYRRIGLAVGEHDPMVADDMVRQAAALWWVRRDEGGVPPLLGSHQDRESFLGWFHQHRPEAVIGFSPQMARWLEESGVRIPRDSGFLSLLRPEDERERQRFAHCGTHHGEALEVAVSLLEDQLRLGVRGFPQRPLEVVVPGYLEAGPSMPPCRR